MTIQQAHETNLVALDLVLARSAEAQALALDAQISTLRRAVHLLHLAAVASDLLLRGLDPTDPDQPHLSIYNVFHQFLVLLRADDQTSVAREAQDLAAYLTPAPKETPKPSEAD